MTHRKKASVLNKQLYKYSEKYFKTDTELVQRGT